MTSETLRLLPQPIYRYKDSEFRLIDGAILAFVQGADPEAFLLIEAREDENVRRWHYAIARSTSWAVTARLDEDVVYDVPFYDFTRHDPSSAFLIPKRMPVK